MIDACNKIGSPQHVAAMQANELGKTLGENIERAPAAQAAQIEARDQKLMEILAGLQLNSQQQNNIGALGRASVFPGLCYLCKKPGHMIRNCPEAKREAQSSDLCPQCRKGRHFVKQCRSKYDIDGNPIPKNFKMNTQRHHAKTQIVVPQIPENAPGVRFVNTLTPKHYASSPAESQEATQTYYPLGPGALWQPPKQQPF